MISTITNHSTDSHNEESSPTHSRSSVTSCPPPPPACLPSSLKSPLSACSRKKRVSFQASSKRNFVQAALLQVAVFDLENDDDCDDDNCDYDDDVSLDSMTDLAGTSSSTTLNMNASPDFNDSMPSLLSFCPKSNSNNFHESTISSLSINNFEESMPSMPGPSSFSSSSEDYFPNSNATTTAA